MRYTVLCPVCGAINKGLDLLETNGTMECIACRKKTVGLLMSVPSRLPRISAGRTGTGAGCRKYRK